MEILEGKLSCKGKQGEKKTKKNIERNENMHLQKQEEQENSRKEILERQNELKKKATGNEKKQN